MPELADNRDKFGHIWVSGLNIGAGDVPFCRECGYRQNTPEAESVCELIQKSSRGTAVVKHEYDPFE